MPELSDRAYTMPTDRDTAPLTPYRTVRPASDKLIFLSCEGCVTEEDYFRILNELYKDVQSKVRFISVVADAVAVLPKRRTREQQQLLSMSRPRQLVQRILDFQVKHKDDYQLKEHPDDEFWVVTDVDNNWSASIINVQENKSYLDEWHDMVHICNENHFHYAVSNPFFEIWLLLHHADPTAEDKTLAVTEEHAYEKTAHFRERLSEIGAPLKNKKHIIPEHYSCQKVVDAVRRAKALHQDPTDPEPHYFATTVYQLVEELLALAAQVENDPGR